MRIITFDGAYQVIADETPQGVYLLWFPVHGWLGEGMVCGMAPTQHEAREQAQQMVAGYADLLSRDYQFSQSERGGVFIHVNGDIRQFAELLTPQMNQGENS